MIALSHKQFQAFRRRYPQFTDAQLAIQFDIRADEVKKLAKQFALKKDKRAFPGKTRMPRWTKAEMEWLRENYSDRYNVDLALELGRSASAVTVKASLMGLKKSDAFISRKNSEKGQA